MPGPMDDTASPGATERGNGASLPRLGGFWQWLRGLFRPSNNESHLRETIEEIIGGIEETVTVEEAAAPISDHERILLSNILKLRHLVANDVKVPRAGIVSVDIKADIKTITAIISRAAHSRLPVYRENLDDVVGMIHIKDVLDYARGLRKFDISKILHKLLIVAPSMRALDLLLEMRQSRVHMALVVDEFGGIDGLITIEDLIEEIVGEIEDEHDALEGPKLVKFPDGSFVADARCTIREFEDQFGPVLSYEEREEDIDTLGGLIFFLADRVPARGELIRHPTSGICFEVIEADPRRVKRLRMRDLPPSRSEAGSGA